MVSSQITSDESNTESYVWTSFVCRWCARFAGQDVPFLDCQPVLSRTKSPSQPKSPQHQLQSSDLSHSLGALRCRINHLHEDVAAEHVAPHRVQIRQRFARRYFLGRFPRGFQFLDAIAGHNQHVPTLGQIGFVPQGAMPRNDLGVVVGQGQNFVGGDNHPIDFSPGAGVDDRVKAVKKSIAHVNHVGLLEVNVDVRVGMRRLEILQHHGFSDWLAVFGSC